MYDFVCSPLFCYTLFALATMDNTTTRCHHQVTMLNALDLFDVMNASYTSVANDKAATITYIFGALGQHINYTLYMFMSNVDKRMVIIEGLHTPHTHRVCYDSLAQAIPWVSVAIIYVLLCCMIVTMSVWSINTCLKRRDATIFAAATPRSWARFLSTLKRFNMVPLNNSS